MDKYLAAYNDDDDEAEEAEEGIVQNTEENPRSLILTNLCEDVIPINEVNQPEDRKDLIKENENGDERIYESNDEKEDDEDEQFKEDADKDFIISDDDQDFFRLRKRSREESSDDKKENVAMVSDAKLLKRSGASRLVSYGEDEDEDVSIEQQEEGEVADFMDVESPPEVVSPKEEADESGADTLHSVKLPSVVNAKCPKAMQSKVTFLHKKITEDGMDLNYSIQGKKNFRNPSIYEKLLEYCRIDEQGTNYPTHLYNPSIFGPESNYKALAEAQNENERKKKKKTQTNKKTSKWDNPSISQALSTAINNLNNSIAAINNSNNNTTNGISSSANSEDGPIKKVPSVGSLIKNIS